MGGFNSAEVQPAYGLGLSPAYCASSGFWGNGSAPMARAAMVSAASIYRSISAGEMVSTSADVVETVTGIVGREILFRAKIDCQQIAYGIGILGAVEAARSHPAGIRFGVAVGLVELSFDIGDDGLELCFGGLRNALGRHLSGTKFLQNGFPTLAIGRDGTRSQKSIDIESAGSELVIVARLRRS